MLVASIVWSSVGTKILQLLLSLSILVVLHEFGHYATARWFGCRVERFFLFFDPWFALFKKKVGDTVYGIGWLPLGGYVKIAGMIDESMDKEQLNLPPQPWEFRSKPAWQRLIIMIGGVTVNILLAFVIYSGILMVWGKRVVPNNTVQYGISVQDSVMYDLGFRDGDKVLAANGKPIQDFNDIIRKVIVSETVTLERDGKIQEMPLPEDLIGSLVEKKRSSTPLIVPRTPAIVKETPDTMNAWKAGIRPGDRVIGVNGRNVYYFDQLRGSLAGLKNQQVSLSVLRAKDTLTLTATTDENGKLGFISINTWEDYKKAGVLDYYVKKYGFFASLPAGVRMAGEQLQFYIDQFRKILTPQTGAYKGVGGFKSMGNIFPGQWDWEAFWSITAFFSIVLAFMNLLPIPALDGGHVVFTIVEMITGRKPNQKFLEVAQIAGMAILIGLMLYANANDWLGWGKGR